jgi:hypothetical protein
LTGNGRVVRPESSKCCGWHALSLRRACTSAPDRHPLPRPKAYHPKVDHYPLLARLAVREGKRVRHRFWQPGGGYDRNITSAAALRWMIDYIHANPVRRGLVSRAEDWEWSRARWYAGLRPVKIEMDGMVLDEVAHD